MSRLSSNSLNLPRGATGGPGSNWIGPEFPLGLAHVTTSKAAPGILNKAGRDLDPSTRLCPHGHRPRKLIGSRPSVECPVPWCRSRALATEDTHFVHISGTNKIELVPSSTFLITRFDFSLCFSFPPFSLPFSYYENMRRYEKTVRAPIPHRGYGAIFGKDGANHTSSSITHHPPIFSPIRASG